MLVTFVDASFSYGDNLIFHDVNFALNEGERVGLIGANGEGKTTLIRLITGEAEAERGQIIKRNSARIGYLEQNGGYVSGNTVYKEMLSVFAAELSAVEKLENLSQRLSATDYDTPEYASVSAQIEGLNAYIASHDCYNVEVKIKTVLNGMGFEKSYGQIVDTMSGGEKTRLKLARLLLEQPDLLILDEPTNHLDLPARESLEKALKEFEGTLLFVSHDRYFISALAERVLEIEDKKLNCYEGGYDFYTSQKSAEREKMHRAAEEAAMRERNAERQSAFRSKRERAEEAERKAQTKKIEAEICKCEAREAELNEQLADPAVAADYKKVNGLLSELQAIKLQLDALYSRYEELL